MSADTSEETTTIDETETHVWVAFGPVGAVGSIHQVGTTFAYRLMDEDYHGMFPTLEVAKGALQAALPPDSGVPEYRAH